MRRIPLILLLLPGSPLFEHALAETRPGAPEDAPGPAFPATSGRPDPGLPGPAKVLAPLLSQRSSLRTEPFSVEVRLPALDHEVLLAQDAAATGIETYDSGGPTVPGRFSPAPNALSPFNGMDRAGTWILRVPDHQALDSGRSLGWALRLTTPADSAFPRTDATADVCLIVDDQIDLIDLTYLQTCLTCEVAAELGSCCATFDYNADDDVDPDDYAVLWGSLTGPVE